MTALRWFSSVAPPIGVGPIRRGRSSLKCPDNLTANQRAGSILYDTSKIVRVCNTEDYVSASLQLFASVLLLFWYVLRIVMRLSKR